MKKSGKAAKDPATQTPKRHKTLPIPSSVSYIPGYPQKLFIYQLEASKYWWVRYFIAGKTLRKSTKSENKAQAIAFAKQFFYDVGYKHEHGEVLSQNSFASCAAGMLKAEAAKLERGELTKATYDNTRYRIDKLLLPYFKARDVASIDYFMLEGYLENLSRQTTKLSLSTIGAYMGLVRKVLTYAARRGFIKSLPEFPHVGVKDVARGWFNTREYRKLWSAATRYAGEVIEIRKYNNERGETETQYINAKAPASRKKGDLMRNVEMTEDMRRLVVFMVNSYIRPTDIKFMQHKHVDVMRGE
jgi:hypothetical protein